MREPFDIDEFIHYASQPGATAPYVREAMGLSYSDSYVNRLIKRHVGKRPSQKLIERPNVLREAVVRYMEANYLDKRYCYLCGRRRLAECAIRTLVPVDPTLDDFVFVCVKCSRPGDF